MKLQYAYHADHHHDSSDRWVHFLWYVGALLLIFAGARHLYLYFTHWEGGDTVYSALDLVIGLAELALGLFWAYRAYVHEAVDTKDPCERYVHIDDEKLLWHLEQGPTPETVPLDRIERVERSSIREVLLHTGPGQMVSFPIYLIVGEEKQREFMTALERVITPASPR